MWTDWVGSGCCPIAGFCDDGNKPQEILTKFEIKLNRLLTKFEARV
jgi:hypothetical protein